MHFFKCILLYYSVNEELQATRTNAAPVNFFCGNRGIPRIWEGGGPRIFFFEIWKFACREAMNTVSVKKKKKKKKKVWLLVHWCWLFSICDPVQG